jgi:D-alanyl-D-alanine carboxypeptidase (penicillin-binding protein 5/6)
VRRRLLASAAAAAAVALAASAAHAQTPACPAQGITAKATIVVEASSEDVVCATRPGARRSVASATKLMTALLVLERARLSDVVPAANYRALPIESKLGLRPGEELTVADLVRGLLLESANDAAVTLAEAVSGSRQAFVRDMNARAAELGLDRTGFVDPIGLGAGNRSSAHDLARLTLELRKSRFFRLVVNRSVATLESGDRVRVIRNRNDLVRRLGWINGVKTGHTATAGYVLVGSGRRRGVQLVSVVLGSESELARSEDTLKVLEFGFGRYRVVRPVEDQEVFGSVPIRYRRGAELPLVAADEVRLTMLRSQAGSLTERAIGMPEEVEGPLERGRRLGTVQVLRGGEVVAEVPLVAASTVPEAGFGQRLKDYFTRPLTIAALLALATGSLLLARLLRRRDPGDRRRGREQETEVAA